MPGRLGLGDLLDLPPLAQRELRRAAAFVFRVQRTEQHHLRPPLGHHRPLARRMIRVSRCPSSSSISRTRSRAVTEPASAISACRKIPGGANLTCYGTNSSQSFLSSYYDKSPQKSDHYHSFFGRLQIGEYDVHRPTFANSPLRPPRIT